MEDFLRIEIVSSANRGIFISSFPIPICLVSFCSYIVMASVCWTLLNKSRDKGHFVLVPVLGGHAASILRSVSAAPGEGWGYDYTEAGFLNPPPKQPTFSFMMLYKTCLTISIILLHRLRPTSFLHQIFVEH